MLRLAWLAPCAVALAYLCVFLAQLPHNIWELGWNSDYASGFTVPATVARTGTGGHTVLGTYSLYAALWFGLLTAWLPLHRELWESAPTALFVLSALIIGWSVSRIASARTGLLAVLIVLIASPAALGIFMAAVAHNTVYPCIALLGAYLVWLARGVGRGRTATLLVPMLAAIVLGVGLASDILLLPTGILPFALTAVIACLRRDRHSRRVGLSALATVLVALPIAALVSATMSSLGYALNSPPNALDLAPLSVLPSQGHRLLNGLERLFNGHLASGAPGPRSIALGSVCEILMAAALLTLLLAGARAAISFIRSGWRTNLPKTPTETAAALHIIYWVSSAIAACGAFVLGTFVDANHEAFYVTVTFSVAAVIPLCVNSRGARWLSPVGLAIFFTASLLGLTSDSIVDLAPLAHYEAYVLKVARAYDATTGYAGYWDASSLTWSSGERVAARPVFACENPGGADLCVFSQETVPSWYAPSRRRTFLLVDAGEPYLRFLPIGLGRPLKAYSFGPMRMYVYSYDIASRLGPSTAPGL